MGEYSRRFGTSMRAVTLWRPSRADSGHGTMSDPTYIQVSGFQARVKERSGAEIIVPGAELTDTVAEITVDLSDAATVRESDMIRDPDHPLGLQVWDVKSIEARGGPVPRGVIKCIRLSKPPAEAR